MTRQHSTQPNPVTAGAMSVSRPWFGLAVVCCTCIGLSVTFGVAPAMAVAPTIGNHVDQRTSSCPKTYTVLNGDFWVGIADKVGVTLSALLQSNNAASSAPLYPGDVLCLPTNATAPAAPATPATTAPSAGTTLPVTGATSASTLPGAPVQVVPLAAFPVQGPCWFADTWMAPRSGGRLHEGVDVIARSGQFIYAVVAGILSRQVWDRPGSLSGNGWYLTAPDGTYYFYAHLSAFAPDLVVGSQVAAGQVIGYIGATGNAAGPHLHFEVHPGGGAPINPTPTVKAVDGCRNRDPLPQPSGTVPAAPAPSTTTAPGASGTSTATALTSPSTVTTTAPPQLPTNTPAAAPASSPATSTATADGALWQFIAPVSAYDTAATGSRIPAGQSVTISTANLRGVLATTSGVMVRLSSRGAASSGYLVVHPCDAPAPSAASLSFPSRGMVVGTTMVSVTDAKFCLTTNVSAGVRVEIIAVRSSAGVGLQAVRATRALDTRTTKRLQPGVQVAIDPTRLGVLPGTQALSATITLVAPSAAGSFSIGFCGSGLWSVPSSSAALSSFAITMRVGGAGWCVASTVATDVVVDITGVWASGSPSPTPVTPSRVFDSRSSTGAVGTSPVAVQIAGQSGVGGDAGTVLIAITSITGAVPGIVFVGPCGEARSDGAAAATAPQRVVTAVVPVRLGGGAVCISALQPVDVIIDVVGGG